MNILQLIYCYAYQSAEDQNSNTDPRKTGTIMASVLLLMWLLSTAFLLLPLGLGELLMDGLQSIMGRSTGKTIGQVLALLLFLLLYPIIKYTIGSESSYLKIIEEYLSIDKEVRGETAAKGLSALIISCVIFVASIIIGSIVATFM